MAAADVLVVMARQPTPGAVKTRLAGRIGHAAACDLYRAFLGDIAATLADGRWRLLWAVTPPDVDLRPIVGATAECLPQRGDDLAARMRHVFDDLFATGAPRVVMIGADAPHLGAAAIAAAFAALDDHDVVLTPTRDGGYCLVGQRCADDLFRDVEMGTERVFAETIERVESLGLRVSLQSETFDVDEWDDMLELRRLLATGAIVLPQTSVVLNKQATDFTDFTD
jgi:rSAM/selenodomain-associated transferase 1